MERDEYLRMASVEDQMWFYQALHAHMERELVRHCGGGAARILDAGCGTGGLIRRMESRHPAWAWTGVDLEPLACELARQRTRAPIVTGSVNALPFPDQTFDALVTADVLYHLDDDEGALCEMHRVLRPHGRIIVNVPAHRWLWSYHDVTVHGRRRYTRPDLRGKLMRAGFTPLRLTHWNALPLPLVLARRKLLPPPKSGSDVRLYPAPVEAMFNLAMAMERSWLAQVSDFPLGSSILALAEKPA